MVALGSSGARDFMRLLSGCQPGLQPYEKSSDGLTRPRGSTSEMACSGGCWQASVYHKMGLPGLPEYSHGMSAFFPRANDKRERESTIMPFYDLVSKVTHNFNFILLVRNNLLNPTHIQRKGNQTLPQEYQRIDAHIFKTTINFLMVSSELTFELLLNIYLFD